MNSEEKSSTLFYKYQVVNDYLLENLKHNQLYYNHPSNYNDPFDSKIYGYSECTEKQWIKDCMKTHLSISRDKAADALKFNIEEGRIHKKGKLIVTDTSYTENSSPLACCFSKEPDNILMWSHYANHHRGVCLSFKASHRPKTIEFKHATEYGLTVNSENIPLYHVRYERGKPKIVDILELYRTLNSELFLDFLLTKSPCWEYEKEYRLISNDNINIKKFKKEELEGIIFGLRIKYCDAYFVYKTIEKNYINRDIPVNFYKAEEVKDEYALEIKKIDNVNEYMESLRNKI
jgi:hypothetical protein